MINLEVREKMVRFLQELELSNNLQCKSLRKEAEVREFLEELRKKLPKEDFCILEDLIWEAFTSIKEDYFTFGSLSETK